MAPPTLPAALEFRIHTISDIVLKRVSVKKKGGGSYTRETVGKYAQGVLVWGKLVLEARCGPWGNGMLPTGGYRVGNKNRDWIAQPSSPGMKIKLSYAKPEMFELAEAGVPSAFTKKRVQFFVPIFPEDKDNHRSELGIHPDGNVTGTAGCIGLVEYDADRFWEAWQATPALQRPSRLVISATDAGWGEAQDWTATRAGRE